MNPLRQQKKIFNIIKSRSQGLTDPEIWNIVSFSREHNITFSAIKVISDFHEMTKELIMKDYVEFNDKFNNISKSYKESVYKAFFETDEHVISGCKFRDSKLNTFALDYTKKKRF